MRLVKPDLRPERANFRLDRADRRLRSVNLSPERADLKPERANIRPDRAEFRPERLDGGRGINEQMDEQKSPRVIQDFFSFGIGAAAHNILFNFNYQDLVSGTSLSRLHVGFNSLPSICPSLVRCWIAV